MPVVGPAHPQGTRNNAKERKANGPLRRILTRPWVKVASQVVGSRSIFIGAVEIGTSKVVVLVGECTGRETAIIGFGECESAGVVKGAIVDYRAASECVGLALERAESAASERIDGVFLAQSGDHLNGFYNEGSVTVRATDNMIGMGDIAEVCGLAQSKCIPPGQRIIDSIRRPFRVDGRLVPDSPENLVGQKLEVGYWTVLGSEQKIADNIHIISGFNLQVHELILSSVASGFIVTNQEERQNGILVLDIGGGTTDYVLYRDGTPHTTGVLPVGGSHFTNDLGVGLRLRPAQAEKLKLRYGRSLVQNRNGNEKVWLDGSYSVGDRTFARCEIEKITSARAWELFDVVKHKLGNSFSPESCSCGVVLTGGGAKLPAMAECASKVFGTLARLGETSLWIHDDLCGPEFHTVVGTLYYGLKIRSAHASTRHPRSSLLRIWMRLFPGNP